MAKQRISGQQAYTNFRDSFQRAYRKAGPFTKDAAITEGLAAGTAAILGHPEYIHLKPGQTKSARAVVGFVDIRGVTKLSFALEPTELLRVIQALTEAAIRSINEGGGYIGEFTGDGVMAYFGDSNTGDEEATLAALETISLLFKSVEEIVNPELKQGGLDPIQIAAGLEFGDVLWSRIGLADNQSAQTHWHGQLFWRESFHRVSSPTLGSAKLATSWLPGFPMNTSRKPRSMVR